MPNKVKLALVGLDGNAFALMGAFKNAAKAQGWSAEEIKKVLDECMTGDYDNLLCTLSDNTEEPDENQEYEPEDEPEDEDDEEDDTDE